MKFLKLIAFVTTAFSVIDAHAIKCMDSGTRYKMVRCEITSSKTYEAGYTEEYGKAVVDLMDYDSKGVIIDLGLASGNVQARVSVTDRASLKLEFNQDMGSWGRQTSQTVKFPTAICGGTIEDALSVTETYAADFKTHAMNLDFNIDCKSYSFFENDGQP